MRLSQRLRLLLVFALAATTALAETRLLVTVVDEKTGEAVKDLKAADFQIDDRGSLRQVVAAECSAQPVDALLLIDLSQVGAVVDGIAPGLIAQLGDQEQMAIAAFSSAVERIQDFTSNKALLSKALDKLRAATEPDVVGAIYESADTGFKAAHHRKVILLISPGKDAGGRVSFEATLKIARKNHVSVYLISPRGFSSGYDEIAKYTAGAAFNLRELSKDLKSTNDSETPAHIWSAVRGNNTLTLAGNLALGDKLKVQIPASKRKLQITMMPLD